jgi:hypothetical protein
MSYLARWARLTAGTALLGSCTALVAGVGVGSAAAVETTVFNSTGYEQTFTVPPDVRTMRVVAVGAHGGGGAGFEGGDGADGGFGALASASIPVTPARRST